MQPCSSLWGAGLLPRGRCSKVAHFPRFYTQARRPTRGSSDDLCPRSSTEDAGRAKGPSAGTKKGGRLAERMGQCSDLLRAYVQKCAKLLPKVLVLRCAPLRPACSSGSSPS